MKPAHERLLVQFIALLALGVGLVYLLLKGMAGLPG